MDGGLRGHPVDHDDHLRCLHLPWLGGHADQPGLAALEPRLLPGHKLRHPQRGKVFHSELRGLGPGLRRGQGELRHPGERGDADRHHRRHHDPRDGLRGLRSQHRHRQPVARELRARYVPLARGALLGRDLLLLGQCGAGLWLLPLVHSQDILPDRRLRAAWRQGHGPWRRPGRPGRLRQLAQRMDDLLLGLVDLLGAFRRHLPGSDLQGPHPPAVHPWHTDRP
mmetsp:Transcript_119870/g.350404  ORF Transcript_119870/g.350404 Transcript_119870/m.350404 type:complete len:224 (+) Transcript_119870:744-1415(+)